MTESNSTCHLVFVLFSEFEPLILMSLLKKISFRILEIQNYLLQLFCG